MLENGFITLHRKFTDWRWYNEPLTKELFLHLLLTANYEDKEWNDITVKRGQRVTTIRALAKELKKSPNTIILHLKRMCKTGEITYKTTNHYTLITIPKYSQYQDVKKSSVSNTDTQADTRPNTQPDTRADTQADTRADTYETNITSNNQDKQRKQIAAPLSPLEAAERTENEPPDFDLSINRF